MELYLAIFAGLGGILGWGLADFFAKKTLGKIDGTRTLMWMQLFGIFPLAIYLIFNWEPARLNPQIILLLFLLGLGQVIAYLLFYRGLEKGLVSILSPVFASQAAVAVLVSAFLFGETIKVTQWLGLFCTFLGIILVSFQQQLSGISGFKNLTKGLPEVLIGMLIFGFFFPYWDWFLGYQQQGWVTSTIIISIIAVIFLALLVLINTRTKKTGPEFTPKEKSLWFWLALIGLCNAFGVLFAAWGFKFTTHTSIIVMVSAAFPVLTVILARTFLKEKLIRNQIIGITVIIAGLIILAI